MTISKTGHKNGSQNLFSVDSKVDIPSEVQALTRNQFLELIREVDTDSHIVGNYSSDIRYKDGVLIAGAGNVSPAKHEYDLLVGRKFSKLSSDENFRLFASRHGFLSEVNELPSIRVRGKELVFEPIADWYYSVRDVGLVNLLIDLCFNTDIQRAEGLIGGVYPPHRIAYMGQWNDDRLELELITPQTFFGMGPTEVTDQNGIRTSAGVVSIGSTRGKTTDKELLAKFGGIGHVYQYISNTISTAFRANLQFDRLLSNARSARFTSAGLRTAIWLAVWEDLKGHGSIRQCESCTDDYVSIRTSSRFCKPTCAQRAYRDSKK